MELSTAIRLIRKGIVKNTDAQTWAELGAGKGLFTQALSSILPEHSSIDVVDQDAVALQSIRESLRVSLNRVAANFEVAAFKPRHYDGILMANALHFVKDRESFVKKIETYLKPEGRLVIVEYDLSRANTWVPWPVNFSGLTTIAANAGFSIVKLETEPSRYNQLDIYSAVLIKMNSVVK
jgi:ubiquinone/menaquinone biosynthesis C-methylase UbiE